MNIKSNSLLTQISSPNKYFLVVETKGRKPLKLGSSITVFLLKHTYWLPNKWAQGELFFTLLFSFVYWGVTQTEALFNQRDGWHSRVEMIHAGSTQFIFKRRRLWNVQSSNEFVPSSCLLGTITSWATKPLVASRAIRVTGSSFSQWTLGSKQNSIFLCFFDNVC